MASACNFSYLAKFGGELLEIKGGGQNMKDEGLLCLCEWLHCNLMQREGYKCVFAKVDLSSNQLTDNSISKLLHLLQTHQIQTTSFKLSKNGFTDATAEYFAEYIKDQNVGIVHELNLSYNRLTDEGCMALLRSINAHPKYPRQDRKTKAYVPTWVALDNNCAAPPHLLLEGVRRAKLPVCLAEDSECCKLHKCFKNSPDVKIHLFFTHNQPKSKSVTGIQKALLPPPPPPPPLLETAKQESSSKTASQSNSDKNVHRNFYYKKTTNTKNSFMRNQDRLCEYKDALRQNSSNVEGRRISCKHYHDGCSHSYCNEPGPKLDNEHNCCSSLWGRTTWSNYNDKNISDCDDENAKDKNGCINASLTGEMENMYNDGNSGLENANSYCGITKNKDQICFVITSPRHTNSAVGEDNAASSSQLSFPVASLQQGISVPKVTPATFFSGENLSTNFGSSYYEAQPFERERWPNGNDASVANNEASSLCTPKSISAPFVPSSATRCERPQNLQCMTSTSHDSALFSLSSLSNSTDAVMQNAGTQLFALASSSFSSSSSSWYLSSRLSDEISSNNGPSTHPTNVNFLHMRFSSDAEYLPQASSLAPSSSFTHLINNVNSLQIKDCAEIGSAVSQKCFSKNSKAPSEFCLHQQKPASSIHSNNGTETVENLKQSNIWVSRASSTFFAANYLSPWFDVPVHSLSPAFPSTFFSNDLSDVYLNSSLNSGKRKETGDILSPRMHNEYFGNDGTLKKVFNETEDHQLFTGNFFNRQQPPKISAAHHGMAPTETKDIQEKCLKKVAAKNRSNEKNTNQYIVSYVNKNSVSPMTYKLPIFPLELAATRSHSLPVPRRVETCLPAEVAPFSEYHAFTSSAGLPYNSPSSLPSFHPEASGCASENGYFTPLERSLPEFPSTLQDTAAPSARRKSSVVCQNDKEIWTPWSPCFTPPSQKSAGFCYELQTVQEAPSLLLHQDAALPHSCSSGDNTDTAEDNCSSGQNGLKDLQGILEENRGDDSMANSYMSLMKEIDDLILASNDDDRYREPMYSAGDCTSSNLYCGNTSQGSSGAQWSYDMSSKITDSPVSNHTIECNNKSFDSTAYNNVSCSFDSDKSDAERIADRTARSDFDDNSSAFAGNRKQLGYVSPLEYVSHDKAQHLLTNINTSSINGTCYHHNGACKTSACGSTAPFIRDSLPSSSLGATSCLNGTNETYFENCIEREPRGAHAVEENAQERRLRNNGTLVRNYNKKKTQNVEGAFWDKGKAVTVGIMPAGSSLPLSNGASCGSGVFESNNISDLLNYSDSNAPCCHSISTDGSHYWEDDIENFPANKVHFPTAPQQQNYISNLAKNIQRPIQPLCPRSRPPSFTNAKHVNQNILGFDHSVPISLRTPSCYYAPLVLELSTLLNG